MSERRDQIIEAALVLWRERGEQFTMDELAAASRVPRAALYRLFPKKAEVLRALSQEKSVEDIPDEADISQRILSAARREFMKSGMQITIEQIAESAGVGVATIYRRFKDKETLFRAAADEQPSRRQLLSLRPDPSKDLTEQLLELVTHLLVVLREHGSVMLVIARGIHNYPELTKAFTERQGRTYQMIAAYLSSLMDAGLLQKKNPEESAISLLALCFFAAYFGPAMKMSEYKGPEHHAPQIVSLFLDGLRAKPQEPHANG